MINRCANFAAFTLNCCLAWLLLLCWLVWLLPCFAALTCCRMCSPGARLANSAEHSVKHSRLQIRSFNRKRRDGKLSLTFEVCRTNFVGARSCCEYSSMNAEKRWLAMLSNVASNEMTTSSESRRANRCQLSSQLQRMFQEYLDNVSILSIWIFRNVPNVFEQ